MVLKVAITGGFGTGKSTVGDILSDEGYPVIDTDEIVHELLSTKSQWTDEIVHAFGRDVVNNSDYYINKKKLATIVFNDINKRKTLEIILHPLVRQTVRAFFRTCQDSKYVFALIPLLFESGQEGMYDEVWCVNCDENVQISRLKKKGFSNEDVCLRIGSQMLLDEKIKRSDFIIDNSDSIENTKSQVLKRIAKH